MSLQCQKPGQKTEGRMEEGRVKQYGTVSAGSEETTEENAIQ